MDAFFVSVELLRRPELRGQPVVVATGTDPGARGVVMAASYEAREFGVHSAMPLAVAHRRCPRMVLLPRDMGRYRSASGAVMEILRRYSEVVEVVGLDEAYLDLTSSPAPRARARALKQEVRAETGLVCSVGIGPNRLVAKIASDLDKPDGLCVLDAEGMIEAVGDRPATLVPGIGPRTSERLARAGIRTVRELAEAPDDQLDRAGGAAMRGLRDRARGVDDTPLQSRRQRKSESREVTFAQDVADRRLLRETLSRLAGDVCRGLAGEHLEGRTVTVKVRFAPFRTRTRSRTLPAPTADAQLVGAVARELLDRFEEDGPVRLVGVGVSSLGEADGDPAQRVDLRLPV